jgi:hypothetical protein
VIEEPEIMVPRNYQEVLRSEQRREWEGAFNAEVDKVKWRGTVELVDEPIGHKILPSSIRYTIKRNPEGDVKRYKARWLVMGNYEEKKPQQTFAPVVKSITIRIMMVLALILGLFIQQLDITNAFCYAKIDGDIYIRPPKELNCGRGKCYKLHKALYGLRTSPRAWYNHLNKFITSLGFKRCILEPCLYYGRRNGDLVLICIYVDDILIAGKDREYVESVKAKFCENFEMTDLGELHSFLNIRVTRTTNTIYLDQGVTARKIVEKYGSYLGTRIRKNPLPKNAAEILNEDGVYSETQMDYIQTFPFREIGALLHLSIHTRPDIAYAVGILSRFSTKVNLNACKLTIYLLEYLKTNCDLGIKFSGNELDLHCFSDADWAGDIITRKSTTEYVVFGAGGPIAWQSRLQTTIATSSMEPEYMAMYGGIQELVWVRGVMSELSEQSLVGEPTPFFIDSQSAEDLAMNPVYHKRSKHIDIKYHWIREHVDPTKYATARLIHVQSINQTADIFTKAINGEMFEKHTNVILGTKTSRSEDIKSQNKIVKRMKKR